MTTLLQIDREELRAEIKNCLRESIEEIKNLPAVEPLPDRITLDDACKLTESSKSQIYKMTMAGSIPFLKYGKRLVFSRSKLLTWMQNRTISKISANEVMDQILAKSAKKHLKK